MGDRESRYVPDLPTTGGQRRASSGHGLEVPLGASSARSSRTLTPSDVPFAAGPNHSTPAKARALNGSAHELHISMPDPGVLLAFTRSRGN